MDFIVKLLFLSGKYLTQAAGRTIIDIINKSIAISSTARFNYDKAVEVVNPYDNMLELLNTHAQDLHTNEGVKVPYATNGLNAITDGTSVPNEVIVLDGLNLPVINLPLSNIEKILYEKYNNGSGFNEPIEFKTNAGIVNRKESAYDFFLNNHNISVNRRQNTLRSSWHYKGIDNSESFKKSFRSECCDQRHNEKKEPKTIVHDEDKSHIGFLDECMYNVENQLFMLPLSLDHNVHAKTDNEKVSINSAGESSNLQSESLNQPAEKALVVQQSFEHNVLGCSNKNELSHDTLSCTPFSIYSDLNHLLAHSPADSYYNTNFKKFENKSKSLHTGKQHKKQLIKTERKKHMPINNLGLNDRIIAALKADINSRQDLMDENVEHFKHFEKRLQERCSQTKIKQMNVHAHSRCVPLLQDNHFGTSKSNLTRKLKEKIDNINSRRKLSCGRNKNDEFSETVKNHRETEIKSAKVNQRAFHKLEREITQVLKGQGLLDDKVIKDGQGINVETDNVDIRSKTHLSRIDKKDIAERKKLLEINEKVFTNFEKDISKIVLFDRYKMSELDCKDKRDSFNTQDVINSFKYSLNTAALTDSIKDRILSVLNKKHVHTNKPENKYRAKEDSTLSCLFKREVQDIRKRLLKPTNWLKAEELKPKLDMENKREQTKLLEINAKVFTDIGVVPIVADILKENKPSQQHSTNYDDTKSVHKVIDNPKELKRNNPRYESKITKNNRANNCTASIYGEPPLSDSEPVDKKNVDVVIICAKIDKTMDTEKIGEEIIDTNNSNLFNYNKDGTITIRKNNSFTNRSNRLERGEEESSALKKNKRQYLQKKVHVKDEFKEQEDIAKCVATEVDKLRAIKLVEDVSVITKDQIQKESETSNQLSLKKYAENEKYKTRSFPSTQINRATEASCQVPLKKPAEKINPEETNFTSAKGQKQVKARDELFSRKSTENEPLKINNLPFIKIQNDTSAGYQPAENEKDKTRTIPVIEDQKNIGERYQSHPELDDNVKSSNFQLVDRQKDTEACFRSVQKPMKNEKFKISNFSPVQQTGESHLSSLGEVAENDKVKTSNFQLVDHQKDTEACYQPSVKKPLKNANFKISNFSPVQQNGEIAENVKVKTSDFKSIEHQKDTEACYQSSVKKPLKNEKFKSGNVSSVQSQKETEESCQLSLGKHEGGDKLTPSKRVAPQNQEKLEASYQLSNKNFTENENESEKQFCVINSNVKDDCPFVADDNSQHVNVQKKIQKEGNYERNEITDTLLSNNKINKTGMNCVSNINKFQSRKINFKEERNNNELNTHQTMMNTKCIMKNERSSDVKNFTCNKPNELKIKFAFKPLIKTDHHREIEQNDSMRCTHDLHATEPNENKLQSVYVTGKSFELKNNLQVESDIDKINYENLNVLQTQPSQILKDYDRDKKCTDNEINENSCKKYNKQENTSYGKNNQEHCESDLIPKKVGKLTAETENYDESNYGKLLDKNEVKKSNKQLRNDKHNLKIVNNDIDLNDSKYLNQQRNETYKKLRKPVGYINDEEDESDNVQRKIRWTTKKVGSATSINQSHNEVFQSEEGNNFSVRGLAKIIKHALTEGIKTQFSKIKPTENELESVSNHITSSLRDKILIRDNDKEYFSSRLSRPTTESVETDELLRKTESDISSGEKMNLKVKVKPDLTYNDMKIDTKEEKNKYTVSKANDPLKIVLNSGSAADGVNKDTCIGSLNIQQTADKEEIKTAVTFDIQKISDTTLEGYDTTKKQLFNYKLAPCKAQSSSKLVPSRSEQKKQFTRENVEYFTNESEKYCRKSKRSSLTGVTCKPSSTTADTLVVGKHGYGSGFQSKITEDLLPELHRYSVPGIMDLKYTEEFRPKSSKGNTSYSFRTSSAGNDVEHYKKDAFDKLGTSIKQKRLRIENKVVYLPSASHNVGIQHDNYYRNNQFSYVLPNKHTSNENNGRNTINEELYSIDANLTRTASFGEDVIPYVQSSSDESVSTFIRRRKKTYAQRLNESYKRTMHLASSRRTDRLRIAENKLKKLQRQKQTVNIKIPELVISEIATEKEEHKYEEEEETNQSSIYTRFPFLKKYRKHTDKPKANILNKEVVENIRHHNQDKTPYIKSKGTIRLKKNLNYSSEMRGIQSVGHAKHTTNTIKNLELLEKLKHETAERASTEGARLDRIYRKFPHFKKVQIMKRQSLDTTAKTTSEPILSRTRLHSGMDACNSLYDRYPLLKKVSKRSYADHISKTCVHEKLEDKESSECITACHNIQNARCSGLKQCYSPPVHSTKLKIQTPIKINSEYYTSTKENESLKKYKLSCKKFTHG